MRNVVVLPVVWRENAAQALDEIVDYISQFDEGAADRLEAQALDCSRNLPHFPHAYRAGRVEGTREAVFHPNYILVYRVGESDDRNNQCHAYAPTLSGRLAEVLAG